MLAAIAQAHNAFNGNIMDIVKKQPSEWNFDVKFDFGDQEEDRPHRRRGHKRWW